MLTDEEAVVLVQQGQPERFALIFARHQARIERYVRRLGLPEADQEDVVAETFARAFARIHSFDPASGSRYIAYLLAIARNAGKDHLLEQRRAPAATFLEDGVVAAIPDVSEQGAPLASLLKHEQRERIRAALARLRPSDREIILLSYERELSTREIMQVMNKPSRTAVTTHLCKAMKRLRGLVLTDAGSW